MTYKPGHHSYLRPPLLPSSPPPVPLDPALQVEDLARISFQNKPLYVGVDDARSVSTREGLEQGYCVVPADKRFLLLFTFLKKNMNKKVGGQGEGTFPYGIKKVGRERGGCTPTYRGQGEGKLR